MVPKTSLELLHAANFKNAASLELLHAANFKNAASLELLHAANLPGSETPSWSSGDAPSARRNSDKFRIDKIQPEGRGTERVPQSKHHCCPSGEEVIVEGRPVKKKSVKDDNSIPSSTGHRAAAPNVFSKVPNNGWPSGQEARCGKT